MVSWIECRGIKTNKCQLMRAIMPLMRKGVGVECQCVSPPRTIQHHVFVPSTAWPLRPNNVLCRNAQCTTTIQCIGLSVQPPFPVCCIHMLWAIATTQTRSHGPGVDIVGLWTEVYPTGYGARLTGAHPLTPAFTFPRVWLKWTSHSISCQSIAHSIQRKQAGRATSRTNVHSKPRPQGRRRGRSDSGSVDGSGKTQGPRSAATPQRARHIPLSSKGSAKGLDCGVCDILRVWCSV